MIKAFYKTAEEIPSAYKDLYEERDDGHRLVRIEGLTTEADVSRIKTALTAEKDAHQKLKTSVREALGGRELPEVQALLDKLPELEAGQGRIDEEKVNTLVEARIKSRLAPIERERDKLKDDLGALQSVAEQFSKKEKSRTIRDEVRKAASKAKVLETAQEDILLLAENVFDIDESTNQVVVKDGSGFTAGLAPDNWILDMQAKRPHWWPASQGGGATGSGAAGAANPWSKQHWNVTDQAKYVKDNGMDKATQAARSAGVTIGATRPAS